MGEEEPGDYRIVLENGTESKSSRDFTGKATAYYDNGDIYDGHFREGLRSGYGKYNYNTGEVYEGDFKDNLKHGFGKMIYPEKGVYHGYFESGKRHGEGVFTYPSGDSYNGWWKDGLKDGKGTYIYKATGIKVKGDWQNGKILRGQWILPNGVYWEGGFDNNKPNGEGSWHFRNGNECSGSFSQNVEVEEAEEGEKYKIDLNWRSHSHIYSSASAINRVVQ